MFKFLKMKILGFQNENQVRNVDVDKWYRQQRIRDRERLEKRTVTDSQRNLRPPTWVLLNQPRKGPVKSNAN